MSFDRFSLEPAPRTFSTEEDALAYLLTPERERQLQRIVIERAMHLTGLREEHLYSPILDLPRNAIRKALRSGAFTNPEHIVRNIPNVDIIDTATINETCFFRLPKVFDALEKMHIEPSRILVLPCATGQEAYSYQMLYPKAHVHAYDVNPPSIEAAKRGFFTEKEVCRKIDDSQLAVQYHERFMHERNVQKVAGGYRISPAIGQVQFRVMNIFSEEFSRDPQTWDLISSLHFFRYLTPEQKEQAMNILMGKLRPNGTLICDDATNIRALSACRKMTHPFIRQKPIMTAIPQSNTQHIREIPSPIRRSSTAPARDSHIATPSHTTPIKIASSSSDLIEKTRISMATLGQGLAALRATENMRIA